MTMNSKQFLEQTIRISNEISALWDELDTVRADATSSGSLIRDTPRSDNPPQSAPFENPTVRLADLEQEIKRDIARLLQKHKRIRHVVGHIQDDRIKAVLRRVYLCREPIEVCAVKLQVSKSTVLRRLDAGYEAVAEITGYPAPPKYTARDRRYRELIIALEEQNNGQ